MWGGCGGGGGWSTTNIRTVSFSNVIVIYPKNTSICAAISLNRELCLLFSLLSIYIRYYPEADLEGVGGGGGGGGRAGRAPP